MSSPRAYYNENNLAAAEIIKQQIADGVIAPGDVDTRSIKDVTPDDLEGYTQCHFFAGGGLWSVAARLAGWPDDRPLWTGSCPCQPFSAAGKGLGTDDPRHLWPDFHRLIRACRPLVIMGEQVAGKAGYGWFDGVRSDLEGEGYASRAVDFPACSVDAPHQRNRLYWIAVDVADSSSQGLALGSIAEVERRDVRVEGSPAFAHDAGGCCLPPHAAVAVVQGQRGHGDGSGRQEPRRPVAETGGAGATGDVADGLRSERGQAGRGEPDGEARGREQGADRLAEPHSPLRNGTYWSDAEWIICHDGKARRAQSGIRLLVDGLPGRVDLWRVAGNAIVPQAAAEVIAAFIDVYGLPSMERDQ